MIGFLTKKTEFGVWKEGGHELILDRVSIYLPEVQVTHGHVEPKIFRDFLPGGETVGPFWLSL
jgi:hypothetical protein